MKGIYARVTSLKHVLFLVFLMDFLPPLKTGSLHFQDEDMFLPVVMRKLKELKHSFIGLKGGNGVHMRQFVAEFNDDIWKGVKLNRTAGLGPVTRQRLRQLRIDEALVAQVEQAKSANNEHAQQKTDSEQNSRKDRKKYRNR